MKQSKLINRIIAVLLTVAVFVTGIPVTTVSAATEDVKGNVWNTVESEVENKVEEIRDVVLDMASPVKAGDWNNAIFVDGLAWNYFHNEVQKDIADKYKDKGIKLEMRMFYKDENGELTGKYGKADLFLQEEGYSYIWEVKPYTYLIEPNKGIGEAQLDRYVKTDPSYKIGDSRISGDEIKRQMEVVHTGYTEQVEYTIKYEVKSNGLVLYQFERNVLKREPNEQTAAETESETESARQKSKYEAILQIINSGYVTEPEYVTYPVTPGNFKDDSLWKKVGPLVAIATAWGTYHHIINNNPSTNNTVSATIIVECDRFLAAVGAACAAGAVFIFDPELVNAEEIEDAIAQFELTMEVCGGDGFIDELVIALEEEDYEKIEEILKEIQEESEEFDKAGKAQPPRDPLVIDLGKEGIKLCSIRNGVNFDLDNNGFAEKTAWIDKEDGFLAYDRNGNGVIDNGGELFGDQVILSDGSKSESGFDALTDVDENYDGVIDCNDSVFASLLVWVDANHNGRSESNELKTLNELNIVSISLEHTEISITDEETGARIAETSNVEINRAC